jgi:hypothetical protein
MKKRVALGVLAFWFGLLGVARAGIADILITEFMAGNNSPDILDNDGDSSDFIELFNAGATAQSMDGWYLTDDPFILDKWRFPSVTIQAGQFLLVWASDKDRRNPCCPLHTNFKLTTLGEALLLVAPDGFTIVQDFAPFPEQTRGFSYGLSMGGSQSVLVEDGASCRVQVPTSGADGLNWTGVSYNDAAWLAGTTGVGYETGTGYEALIRTSVASGTVSCYVRIPFQVADPMEVSSLDLDVKYDDGFIAYINGTRVGSKNAPPAGAEVWNSTTSGGAQHDDTLAVVYEDTPLIEGSPVLQAGTNILAIQALNANNTSSDFLVLPRLVGSSVGDLDPDTRLYFPMPTPGAANLQGFETIADTPEIMPEAAVFTGSLQVVLSVDSPSTQIRYTTDGTDPTAASTLYAAPFNVTTSTLVRAKGFEPSGQSPTVSRGFIALGASASTFTSNLPVILIDMFGRAVPGSGSTTYQVCFMALFEPGPDGRTRLTGTPSIVTRGGIRIRGSSSAGFAKKSFAFESWGEDNQDASIQPLDLPREADWVLFGSHLFDRCLMRNELIYELSRQSGEYAARSRFTEMFLNENGGNMDYNIDYVGVYSLMEKLERDANRINVPRLTAADNAEPEVTGGYVLKVDRTDPGESSFSAGSQGSLNWVYPKQENVTSQQTSYIQNFLNQMSNNLYNGGYASYIELDAWMVNNIMNTLAMNVDAYRLSGYYYKDRMGRVISGPIWDFDRTMESTDGRDDNPLSVDGTGDSSHMFGDSRYPWWGRLFQTSVNGTTNTFTWPRNTSDPWQRWRDLWYELRRGPLTDANMALVIQGFQTELTEAAVRNFQKWTQGDHTPRFGGWTGEISNMRNWLITRAGWIDVDVYTGGALPPPTISPGGGQITPGLQATISGVPGTIYYKLDGTDPRASGGNPAAGAVQYAGPITISQNTRVVARVRRSNVDWSPPAAVTFYTELPPIRITELMYHPPDPPPESIYDADDFEYVEILNIGASPVNLLGAYVGGGIDFEFAQSFVVGGGTILGPGEYLLIVKSLAAFTERYGTDGLLIAGEYTGNLDNAGDCIELVGPLLEPILDFCYEETWFPETDGDGPSLGIVDEFAPPASWGVQESWAPSSEVGGSPGTEDGGFANLGGRQIPSDSNQDGAIDVSDGFHLLLRLFGETPIALPCDGATIEDGGNLELFDADGNTAVDLGDALRLLNRIFLGGEAPVGGESCIRIEGCPNVCLF